MDRDTSRFSWAHCVRQKSFRITNSHCHENVEERIISIPISTTQHQFLFFEHALFTFLRRTEDFLHFQFQEERPHLHEPCHLTMRDNFSSKQRTQYCVKAQPYASFTASNARRR